jgi:excisionase family DNA binding protein
MCKPEVLTAGEEYLSTGSAAALCQVTSDTVLKWIKSGKLDAYRTPGGHHRIKKSALSPILKQFDKEPEFNKARIQTQFCWEFYAFQGHLKKECQSCVVYRSRARRCYELALLPGDPIHNELKCDLSCEACAYYRLVHLQLPSVLVVTINQELRSEIARTSDQAGYAVRFVDDEYLCAQEIQDFRPDFVVIDDCLGSRRAFALARRLSSDPRIPLVRIVLTGSLKRLSEKHLRTIFAYIKPRLTAGAVTDLLRTSFTE